MDELRSKLFWHLLPHCSNANLLHLQKIFGALPDPQRISRHADSGLAEALWHQMQNALNRPSGEFRQRLEYASNFIHTRQIRLIERGSPDYPALLEQIADPPALLYAIGRTDLLQKPQIAIVGSRASSRSGQRDAEHFASALVASGFVITSGLALGIDSAAHLGALKGEGLTLAVIGSGLDKVYPRQNKNLYERIIASDGLLISEFPPGTPPLKENFPKRNRLISGLSLATLVVEASERSGSLITARLALEQGREVLVLPGSIHDPLKSGCHRLIRDGAALIQSPDQLLEDLGSLLSFQLEALDCTPPLATEQQNSEAGMIDPELNKVFSHIEFEPISLDTLLDLTKMTVLDLEACLTDLELHGLVMRSPEGIKRLG